MFGWDEHYTIKFNVKTKISMIHTIGILQEKIQFHIINSHIIYSLKSTKYITKISTTWNTNCLYNNFFRYWKFEMIQLDFQWRRNHYRVHI